jgi:hypothetical protein
MKDLKDLIEAYERKIILHEAQANKPDTTNKEYHLGIAEGYRRAADELRTVNNILTQQLQKLF